MNTRKLRSFSALMLAGMLLLAACSPATSEVNIGADANATQLELKVGQMLVISLESNPSTGYGWHVAEVDESILKQVGEVEFIQEPTDEQIVGAGGTEVLRFEAAGAGTTTLTLTYNRAWEDVNPEETFTVTVVIP